MTRSKKRKVVKKEKAKKAVGDTTEEVIADAEKAKGPTEDKVTDIAFNCLLISQQFKQPRMNQIKKYIRLYYNDLPPKARQLFNIPIPVFSGMIDTLQSDYNDPITLKFDYTNLADYLYIPLVQAHFDDEKNKTTVDSQWNMKARWGRFNAMFSGRTIHKIFAESDPEYKSVFETVHYEDFHCQPLGGGNLENHLFAGEESIIKTAYDLENNSSYDQEQVKKLVNYNYESPEYNEFDTAYGDKLQRFRSLGMDPLTNTYVGEKAFNMCQFVVTYQGKRWYVLFHPITRIWVRVAPLKDIDPSGVMPWVSSATHEDQKLFWSKSYADDLFQAADGIITLFNQDLTNRERQNFRPRAYDEEMFEDVGALDAASFKPDTLVPVNTHRGERKISEGLYHFETPTISGTIDMVKTLEDMVGRNVGVSDMSQGATKGARKPTVVIAQQQQHSKRIGFRSDSFQIMWQEIGVRFFEGLKENMPPSMAVKIVGENGFAESKEMKRAEITTIKQIGVKVISTSQQQELDNAKKEARIRALGMVGQSPNINSRWRDENALRYVGDFSDEEIATAMDTQTYGSKKMIAHASKVIQQVLAGRKPEVYYAADTGFLTYIQNYIKEYKEDIGDKYIILVDYIKECAPIVAENMARKANDIASGRAPDPNAQDKANEKPVDATAKKKPNISPVNRMMPKQSIPTQ